MRITSLARRSVATVSVTALLAAGGFASGLTVGVANAQTVTGVYLASGAAPTAVNNGVVAFKVEGSDFKPTTYDQETVLLHPVSAVPGQADITTTLEDNTDYCDQVPVTGVAVPDGSCTGPLLFSADLTNAAPIEYQVIVIQNDLTGTETERETAPNNVSVISVGNATASTVGANGATPGALAVTGTNIFHGARVLFYKTVDGVATTPDDGIVFTPTAYVGSTRVEGTYVANGTQADGLHFVRVFNTDQQNSPGTGPSFVQPRITSIDPSTLGQGASSVPVTVTGGGFDSNTTASYSDPKVTASGTPTASTSTTLIVPTSVAGDTTLGAKSLTLRGTGGSFATAANVLNVTEKPVVTQNVATRGQGSSAVVTITGTGFNGSTDFDLGPDVTTTTTSATSTTAQVQVTVGTDAPATTRDVKATNSDFGSSTRAAAFTVAPKPVITKITPPSGNRGDAKFVTITGTNLPASGSAQIAVGGTDITVGPITGSGGNPGSLQTTFNIGSGAAYGPRDVAITNTSNGGTSNCDDCFGVNSLAVSPAGTTNSEDSNASDTDPELRSITVTGEGMTADTVVTLSLPGNPSYQPTITGTGSSAPAGNSLTRLFNLHSAATGDYTVTATTGEATPLVCIGCFKVFSAAAPTVTGITPNNGGQGAIGRTATVTGTNFSRGENVTFTNDSPTPGGPSGISVSNVVWDSPTQLTITYNIAEDAVTGGRGVRVTNIGDDASGKSIDTLFTVNPGAKVTGIDPDTLGQGAKTDLTVTGSNFAAGAKVTLFGQQLTPSSITASQLVVPVTVPADADTAVKQPVRVTNTDGGSSAKAEALTITPAPIITAVSPSLMKPGTSSSTVTITGSGFAEGESDADPPTPVYPTLIIAGVTSPVTAVAEDGTSMTATFTVPANAVVGPRTVRVINPDKGESTKTGAFAVGYPPPTAPTVTLTPGDGRVTVSLSGANGQGTTITGYTIHYTDGTTAKDVNATASPVTITGLTNGTTYTFTVVAKSSGGTSPASTPKNATPRFAMKLTSTRNVNTSTAGSQVTFSGVLYRAASGARVSGAPIKLTFTPDVGTSKTVTVATNASGVWGLRYNPIYNTTVRASFGGSGLNAPVNAPIYKMGVAPSVVRKSPASSSYSGSSTTLYVKGYVYPNKAGRVVYLLNGSTAVGRATVQRDGSFAIPSRLARGTYILKVAIAPSIGNIYGQSALFRIYRT